MSYQIRSEFWQTATGKTLEGSLDLSLGEYLSSLCPPKGFGSQSNNRWRDMLIVCLQQQAGSDILQAQTTPLAVQMRESPVIQMADGSNTLMDTETFLNNYLSYVAIRSANLQFSLVQQCTRNKAYSGPNGRYGSGIIELDSDIYNIFGLSNSRLESHSIATIGKVTARFNAMGVKTFTYANPSLPALLQPLAGVEYSSASDAMKQMNAHIWRQMTLKPRKVRVQFDERLTTALAADILLLPASPLHDLLFRAGDMNEFINVRNREVNSDHNVILRETTDLFYYNHKGRLAPMRYVGQRGDGTLDWEYEAAGTTWNLNLDRLAMVAMMRDGNLYPDLYLSYLILVILPRTLAIGGASQHVYLPQIRSIFGAVDKATGFLSAYGASVYDDYGQGGSRMISGLVPVDDRLRRFVWALNPRSDFAAFDKEHLGRSIRDAVGDMSYFSYFNMLFDRREARLKGAEQGNTP